MCYISVSKNNITTKSNTTQQVESFMGKNITVQDKKKQVIDAIQPTDEHLTSRAGLALFAQYLQNIRLMPIIERMFGSMRKNKKGIAVSDFLRRYFVFSWTAAVVISVGSITSKGTRVMPRCCHAVGKTLPPRMP